MSASGFPLVVAALRPPGSVDGSEIRSLAGRADWTRVLAVAHHHKVVPQLTRGLAAAEVELPPTVGAALKDRNRAVAEQALGLIATVFDVMEHLSQRSIRVVPFKGPVLAKQLFGDLAARESTDVDLLVRRSDALRARQSLERAGFSFWTRLRSEEEGRFLRYGNEYGLRSPDGVVTELEWALGPRYLGLPDVDDHLTYAVLTDINGHAVPTLVGGRLLYALGIHGSKHLWERLAWVVDLAWLVESTGPSDLELASDIAAETGSTRMLALGLEVARRVIGGTSPSLPRGLMPDRAVGGIADRIVLGLEGAARPPRPLRPTIRLLDSPLRSVLAAWRLATTPTVGDWRFMRLPEWCWGGYYVIRPVRLLRDSVRRVRDGS